MRDDQASLADLLFFLLARLKSLRKFVRRVNRHIFAYRSKLMSWARFWKRVPFQRGAKPRSLRRKLELEILEDRTVPTTLNLSIVPSTFAENAGPAAATGTVTRSNTDFSNPLTVNLASSDTTEAVVP